jgi:hypothetical protein
LEEKGGSRGACLKVEVEGLKGSAWFGTFELKTSTDLSVAQLAKRQQPTTWQ